MRAPTSHSDLEVFLEQLGLDLKTTENLFANLNTIHLKRNERFFTQGDQASYVGFLQKGLLVAEHVNEDGDKITRRFYYEGGNRFVVDYPRFRDESLAEDTIRALEDSTVLALSKTELEAIERSHPSFRIVKTVLFEQNYLDALERVKQLQTLKKEKLVKTFYKEHKSLFSRAPHYMIASYLGMHRNKFAQALRML